MKDLTIDEAVQQYPFLRGMQFEYTYIPLEIRLVEFDDELLNLSLLENESRAAGHFNVKKNLYIAHCDKLHSFDVNRLPTIIWPPAYLYPNSEDTDYEHTDQLGYSETIREALSRQNLTTAQYIVLYTRGSNGSTKRTNNILIAPVKK